MSCCILFLQWTYVLLNNFICTIATPTLILVINDKQVNANETIIFSYGQQYSVVCLAIDSRPDLSLSIYDSTTQISLATNNTNVYSNSTCNPTSNLCTGIYEILFDLDNTDHLFDQMTSLTCYGTSTDPNFGLTVSSARNVQIEQSVSTTSTTVATSESISYSSLITTQSNSISTTTQSMT